MAKRQSRPRSALKSLSLALRKELSGRYWTWSVELDGSDEDLDRVDHVEYVLPSTFPRPVRTVKDRASRFRLSEEGQARFKLYASAFGSDETEIPLELDVEVGEAKAVKHVEKSRALTYAGLPVVPPADRRVQQRRARMTPPFRRLRVYAFDPSLATRLEMAVINQVTLQVQWEGDLSPGPVGEYLEVVDFDPASNCFYAPVDLNDGDLLAQDGLPPSEGTPQFHQQMVYAVAMTTIRNFEKALGRLALWAPHFEEDEHGAWHSQFVRRLRIYPHALRQANAYYSPPKKALLFGYFPADASDPGGHLPGGMVFTCLSHDVIVHETTHALLDGLHRRFVEPSNEDSLAFHEAFSDICALFQHFSFPQVLRHQIARTRGDLQQQNLLGELAQQFGQATGQRGALRSAIGEYDKQKRWTPLKPDPAALRVVSEPHHRGSILVAAVFDAYLSIYKTRIVDLLRIATGGSGALPEGELHPDLVNRLAEEAAKTSKHILNMCIRALDYCPPIDLTFGEYLRALITSDYDLVRDDDRRYRVAVIEAFRRRGIYPRDLRTLSEDSLRWHEPTDEEQEVLKTILPESTTFQAMMPQWDLNCDRESVYWELQQLQARLHERLSDRLRSSPAGWALLGLDGSLDGGKFEVHSARPARRIGPDGQQIVDLIVEITQRQPVFFRKGQVVPERTWAPGPGKDADFWFRGGCTLIVNPETGEVRYVVMKRITDQSRLRRQAEFVGRRGTTLRATYFGAVRRLEESEAFAMLHGERPREVSDEMIFATAGRKAAGEELHG